jgi:colanic acid/amylovoran biosynthesis glycosyltransferase
VNVTVNTPTYAINFAMSRPPMRILIVTSRFPVLSETFVLEQARSLRKAGAMVEVLSLFASDPDTLRKIAPEFTVHAARPTTLSSAGKTGALLRFLCHGLCSSHGRRALATAAMAAYRRLPGTVLDIALLFNQQYRRESDLILAHFGQVGVTAEYFRSAALMTGRLGTVFHGFDMSVDSIVAGYLPHYKRLFSSGDVFMPVSQFFARKLASWGCDPRKIHVCRMGVDPREFRYSERAPETDVLKVLTVGRLTEKKGVEYAIRAMALAPKSVQLTIVGSGLLEGALRILAGELGVASRVAFRGAQSHAEVNALLRSSDVFLLPSVTARNGDMEGIPVALMEAMASGVVTISTKHSGIPELVKDMQSGFLVEERDHVALADVIRRIASRTVDLATIKQNARRTVVQHFNPATEAKRLLAHLEGALGSVQPAPDNDLSRSST